MATYRAVAGAIPAVHDRKIVKKGDILPESFFREGEIGDLIRGKFIELADATPETSKPTEPAESELDIEIKPKKKP